MADQQYIVELINQAISCEYPHNFGKINLNRLREVLILLVSLRPQCHIAQAMEDSNEQVAREEKAFPDRRQDFVSVEHSSFDLEKAVHPPLSTSPELNDSMLDIPSIANTIPSMVMLEQSFRNLHQTPSLWEQNRYSEMVCQKVNELIERVLKVEAKIFQIETISLKTKVESVIPDDDEMSQRSSKSNFTQHRDEREATACEVIENESIKGTNAEDSHPRTSNGSLTRNAMDLPPRPLDSETSIALLDQTIQPRKTSKTSFTDITSLTSKTEEESSTNAGDMVGNELKTVEHGQESHVGLEGKTCFEKYQELATIVAALMERAGSLSERQTNMERMFTSFKDDLESIESNNTLPTGCRHEREQLAPPLSRDKSTSNMIEHESYQNDDHLTLAEKLDTNTFITFENEVRATLAEIRNDILLLGSKLNVPHLKHAAGGKLPLQADSRVQCISCDKLATMSRFTDPFPKPMHVATNRCLKPFLRAQLAVLQKDFKHAADKTDIMRFMQSINEK